ncbi:MAG: alpha-ketoacid dehydrogenase subunit beta [Nanoarchaeota archaeon]
MVSMNNVEAVKSALDQALKSDKSVVVLGEDVGVNGGVFRATEGLQKKYGKDRVIDTPLSEEGIVGMAIGMAVNGIKPVAEIQFSGFLPAAFDQIFSHAARIRSRSRGRFTCPIVIRAPAGGGIRALELHCEMPEAFFAHIPGLKVVCPSTPYDTKGLLLAAIKDPDPVIFLEPMRLYRAIKQDVPETEYTLPLGKANVVKEGSDITIITWGAMVKYTLDAVSKLKDVDAEVIDLRTIYPFDAETIIKSVKKTGRALVVHEAPKTAGFGAEIVATINEKALDSLEAPIMRVTGYDIPLPFARLEMEYIPSEERIIKGINKVMEY